MEQPSWKHGYVIYLKMFYEIRSKWEQTSDPEKLQQLYGQLNKYVMCVLFVLITSSLCFSIKCMRVRPLKGITYNRYRRYWDLGLLDTLALCFLEL